jgi:ATP-dependent DNA helicase RecG
VVITVDSRVEEVLGGSSKVKKFHALGIETVGQLLRHFPRRYVDTGKLTDVEHLEPGQMLTVVGEVAETKVKTYQDRRTHRTAYRVETVVATGGPRLTMSFFAKHQGMAEWRAGTLPPGRQGIFIGQAKLFRDTWQLTHPKMVLVGSGDDAADDVAVVEAMKGLFPVYPLTAGLESWDVQRAVTFARSVVDHLPEIVPPAVRRERGLRDAERAFAGIHAPEDEKDRFVSEHYFRFEEALVTQLVLARRRRAVRAQGAVARDGGDGALLAAFDERLPFELTAGQRAVGEEIDHDLAQPHPMNRLLQGEVGSGKTLVALRAVLRVIDSGGQAALLAPTEVLAQQHFRSISAMLGDLASGGMLGGADVATRVELLTGSMTRSQRTEPLSRIASGESGLLIGTHALLEDTVMFADLGLVVVDEQHRFGVEQRAALTDKAGSPPHVLVMTATPIPRTVAMTVFGDLETSTLDELPAGRAPIQTTVVSLVDHPGWMPRVWERVREEVGRGHQVYVVCPRISGDVQEQGEVDYQDLEDDTGKPAALASDRLAAVDHVLAELTEGPLAGLRLAALHGRMPPEEKDATMRAFAAGDVDVLVSTTVIEVGVDVHNATGMVILDADRFGVSQLHQLRGRVGRGGHPGLCLLVSWAEIGSPARDRLDAVARTSDGFELSRVDLEQRREGDVLGASQSGWRSTLATLRVLRDEKTIVAAREAAEALLDDDPDLTGAPDLRAAVTALEATAEADFLERS